MSLQIREAITTGTMLLGGFGLPLAMWGGASAQNIGKIVIHHTWGVNIACDVAYPHPAQSKIGIVANLIIKVTLYVGSLSLYNFAITEFSLTQKIIMCLTCYARGSLIEKKLPEVKTDWSLYTPAQTRLVALQDVPRALIMATCVYGVAGLFILRNVQNCAFESVSKTRG